MKKKSTLRTPELAPAAPSLWHRLWPYLLVAALAFGVYANALNNGFVSDDDFQLLSNPLVTDWHQIPQIFQHHIWAFAGQDTTNYYRPIQMVLYMALYYAVGFDASIFHLMMILIHMANSMLVYRVAGRLLKNKLLESNEAALAAAILFAVHPIHNEAVMWIAVLPDELLTLITLIALGLFIRWDAAPNLKQVGALLALFFLGLITKEPGAMLLPLLAGYEFLYLGRSIADLWKNRTLYISMAAVFGIYCVLRVHALGGMAPAQGFYYKLHGKDLALSLIALLGKYLGKLVLPTHLSYFHFFEPTTSITPTVVLSFLAACALVAGIFLLRGRLPAVSYGLFFILAPLAPALNINGVGENAFTERYLYLPSFGFVLAAAVAWQWLAARQRQSAWSVIVILVALSAYVLIPRNLDWHDDIRLFTVSAEQSPRAGTLIGNLGWFHYQRGEYDDAIKRYHAAIALQPTTALFHNNLGNAYAQKHMLPPAIAELRRAIELKNDYPEAHMNLGLALEASGDIPGAIAEHKKALELKPKYAEALTALALLRMKEKDYPAAFDLLNKAVEANPRYTEAFINLGVAYNDTSHYKEGAAAFKKAIETNPTHPSIYICHYNLGLSYSNLNSLDAAELEFAKALQIKPDFAEAKQSRDKVREAMKQRPAKQGFGR